MSYIHGGYMEKASKNSRTLDMYVRLCEGKLLNKSEEAARFGVDERSIQRYIDDIRAFLDERNIGSSDCGRSIIFDKIQKGYLMRGNEGSLMSNSEILAISKILLGSRAFTKKEISSILDKLISGCVPQKNMKLVSDLVTNEKYHYVELRHTSSIKDKMWALGNDIKQNELVELTYIKQVKGKEKIKRIVEPVALLFSDYYFYLHAFIVEANDGKYEHLYDYPAIFRLDRIAGYRELGKKFKISYTNRFEEGEFRKRVQFMFSGELQHIRFSYSGSNIDSILDRIPSAKIVSEDNENYLIDADVYGKGILMWMLSQGNSVELIKPEKLRLEMKEMLKQMIAKYE